MRKLLQVLAIFAVLTPACGALAAATRPPVALRSTVIVQGPVVRLGDLFDGLEEKAGLPVARAPAVGAQVQLEARWLSAVARRYGVPWRPTTVLDRAVVERAGQVIDSNRIEAEILAGLRRRGQEGDLAIQLDNPSLSLRLPIELDATLRLTGLSFDPAGRRFVAHIVAPDNDRPVARSTVSGRVYRMTEVPTLVQQVAPGSIVRSSDVAWIKFRADRLGRGVILDPSDLIGMSPRRPIRVGDPIRQRDLREPVMVAKNSLVTIVLQSDRMMLTAQGRAMEDGAQGRAIRVMNTKSNTIITAVVQSAGMVAVRLRATVALNQ